MFPMKPSDGDRDIGIFINRPTRPTRWFPINANRSIERSFIMAKDRLITPSYCFILAANFLLYFGFLVVDSCFAVLFIRILSKTGNSTIGIVLFLLYGSRSLHPSIFPVICSTRFAPQNLLLSVLLTSSFMMMFGGYFNSRLPYLIYYIPNHSWHLFSEWLQ